MTNRPTADIVSDLNLPSTVRFCAASAVQQYRFDAAERLTALDSLIESLAAERDVAQAKVAALHGTVEALETTDSDIESHLRFENAALSARVAAVNAALDQYEKERPRAIAIYDCVSAIAEAVGR